jgi:Flp pilus assembly protein TadD
MTSKVAWSRNALCGVLLVASTGCQSLRGPGHASAAPAVPDHLAAEDTSPALGREQTESLHLSLGRAYELQGQDAQATAEYRKAVNLNNRSVRAHWRLGVLADKRGEFAEAQVHYQAAIKLQPGNVEMLTDLGYSYYLSRQWVDSERTLREALARQADHPRARNNLGMALAMQSRYAEAMEQFRAVGNNAAAHCNLGFALAMQQRQDEARRAYEVALAESPGMPVATAGLARLPQYSTIVQPAETTPLPVESELPTADAWTTARKRAGEIPLITPEPVAPRVILLGSAPTSRQAPADGRRPEDSSPAIQQATFTERK